MGGTYTRRCPMSLRRFGGRCCATRPQTLVNQYVNTSTCDDYLVWLSASSPLRGTEVAVAGETHKLRAVSIALGFLQIARTAAIRSLSTAYTAAWGHGSHAVPVIRPIGKSGPTIGFLKRASLLSHTRI